MLSGWRPYVITLTIYKQRYKSLLFNIQNNEISNSVNQLRFSAPQMKKVDLI